MGIDDKSKSEVSIASDESKESKKEYVNEQDLKVTVSSAV